MLSWGVLLDASCGCAARVDVSTHQPVLPRLFGLDGASLTQRVGIGDVVGVGLDGEALARDAGMPSRLWFSLREDYPPHPGPLPPRSTLGGEGTILVFSFHGLRGLCF